MAKKVKRVKKVMNMQRRPSAKAAVQAAAQSSSESTTYYVHGPRGILAQKDSSQNWEWMMQDGLGSVRSVVDNSSGVEWSGSPDPFGSYFGEAGTRQTPYGFTGEYTDPITGMVHLRARDYHPALGVFPALDPFEGVRDEPMSINRYSYVQGNPVNWIDSTGNCPQDPWFNDLPGQRCIWLANELSQHYGWPLDVLMQKDVLELETIYTFGNANNTFNESSWSQSVRNIVNDNLPAIVWGRLELSLER